MIIGLTGFNGSGKGIIAEYLVSQKGFMYYSLSDAVREEVLKKYPEVTREHLITTANSLRQQYGPSVLADRIVRMLDMKKNCVVDSFRNPEEIKAFKKLENFELWFIDAPREIRFGRIKARHREQDPQTLEEFIRIEEKEMLSFDPSSQNLTASKALAQRTIINDTTKEAAYLQVDQLLKEFGHEKKL